MEVDIKESLHKRLGASSSERWMNCTGSQNLINKIPRDKRARSGMAAALGTSVHTMGSTCLEQDIDAWELAGTEYVVDDFKFIANEEMVGNAQIYVDYVRGKMVQFPNAQIFVERYLETILDDDAGGTSDCIIYVPGDRLIVIDYKNGMMIVEPSASQLKYYGALALENIVGAESVKVIELVIVQPRMPHAKGVIRKAVMSAAEIETWFREEALVKMQETRDPDAPLTMGEWCGFCPAKDFCPAINGTVLTIEAGAEPSTLTDIELGAALAKFKMVSKRLTQLELEAFERAQLGRKIPGKKLVNKKANRVFKDSIAEPDPVDADKTITLKFQDEVVKRFGDDAYEAPSIKSPPGIEKLVGGKAFVSRWAYKPNTGITLADEDDDRPEVKPLMDSIDGSAVARVAPKSLMEMAG